MVRIELRESDVVAAMWLHARPSGVPLYVMSAGLLLFLAAEAYVVWTYVQSGYAPELSPWNTAPYLGGLVALAAAWALYLRWTARRSFRQSKLVRDAAELSWDDSRLTTRSESGHSAIAWSDYVKWKENDQLYLVYISDHLYHVVPKRAFGTPELEASFRANLPRIGANQRAK